MPRDFIPNTPTLQTLSSLEEVINQFPAQRRTPELLEAVVNYRKALTTKPLSIYEYIRNHIGPDGELDLTPAQLQIFIIGLAFRVLPTLGELVGHSASDSAANMHTDALTENIGDEKGDGKKLDPHPSLFFESLHLVGKRLGIDLLEDMDTYAMVDQIIQWRRERKAGNTDRVDFKPLPELIEDKYRVSSSAINRQWDAQFERFQEEIKKAEITLPHQVKGIELAGNPTGSRREFMTGRLKKLDVVKFKKACALAALMPDEVIDYARATERAAERHGSPKDSLSLLITNLNTQTREGNAAKGSHNDTYDMLLQALKKYFGADEKRAMLWSQIHIGEEGVEDVHAAKLRKQVIALVKANEENPHLIAQALNEVTYGQLGYITRQEKHWDAVIAAMEEARVKDPAKLVVPPALQRANKQSDAFTDRAVRSLTYRNQGIVTLGG